MFSKLVVTLVTMAVVGASVLSMRHARLEAVHDLANTQRRVLQADRELWRLRAGVASFAQPARVRELAHGLGPLVHVIDAPRISMTLAADHAQPVRGFGDGAGHGPGDVVDAEPRLDGRQAAQHEDFGGDPDAEDSITGGLDDGVLVITADDALAEVRRGRARGNDPTSGDAARNGSASRDGGGAR